MTADGTWRGDVVSLVEAFRSGERSPVDEVRAALAAIESSDLNAFSFVDAEGALDRAETADVSLPLGGVPVGVKELHQVEGWPDTHASLLFAGRTAPHDGTMIARLKAAGANLVGLTTASEFGGLNCSTTKLNGITRNPWRRDATPGGSSGGSAAAVTGGLVPIATGGDGGGSIRIPAGFCGLVGMKGTAGRIPRGPHTAIAPMTVVSGCLARSVRDAARFYDVCAGFDARDPYSLPAEEGWEAGLSAADLRGLRVCISPDLGSAILADAVRERVLDAGHRLVDALGLDLVDVGVSLQRIDWEWAIANQVGLYQKVGDLWPGCEEQMTTSMAFGMRMGLERFDLGVAARVEAGRTEANERMAALFDQVDIVICSSNPDVAFPAEVESNTRVAGEKAPPGNNGALTIPANVSGNPAVSVPAGLVDGLPVGLQLMGRQHEDRTVLGLAAAWEQVGPWPLVAP
ncbi:MAG: amidase [Acidimicrobiales bacterium]|nr:amidase [Acidimicrobiales bacterium]MDP7507866.1 amidase [Acidimicrobiales bacterium]